MLIFKRLRLIQTYFILKIHFQQTTNFFSPPLLISFPPLYVLILSGPARTPLSGGGPHLVLFRVFVGNNIHLEVFLVKRQPSQSIGRGLQKWQRSVTSEEKHPTSRGVSVLMAQQLCVISGIVEAEDQHNQRPATQRLFRTKQNVTIHLFLLVAILAMTRRHLGGSTSWMSKVMVGSVSALPAFSTSDLKKRM